MSFNILIPLCKTKKSIKMKDVSLLISKTDHTLIPIIVERNMCGKF